MKLQDRLLKLFTCNELADLGFTALCYVKNEEKKFLKNFTCQKLRILKILH